MPKNKKKKHTRFKGLYPFVWGFLFFVFVLWLAYNCSPQIEMRLGNSNTIRNWVSEHVLNFPSSSEDEILDYEAPLHYELLEIPAPFTDGRPHKEREYIGYTISYNTQWRLPNWVAYELLCSELKIVVPRKDDFRPDESLGLSQATLADYRRSGFDRGHMAPAADMRWSAEAMSQSFYLTNICPQTPGLNQGDWKRLEDKIRDWAQADSAIVIVCGPLVSSADTTIGPNKVKVPSAFYKVVLAPYAQPPRGIGFLFANDPERRKQPLEQYAVTIDSIETLSGIDFFPVLPDEIETFVESRYDADDWNF